MTEKKSNGNSLKLNPDNRSPICRTIAKILFPITLLYGSYIAFHGHLTPGGAFPAGIIFSTAFLMMYLSKLDHPIEKLRAAERAENFAVPLIIIILTISLLEVFIGPEAVRYVPGNLYSALEILSLNIFGAIKVGGAMIAMIVAFFMLGRSK